MREFSDVELINNHLAGDSAAFEQLVTRYFRQVFLFARTFGLEIAEAEDVTQEVFVRIWKNLNKFDQNKKFKTWAFQITKNACIDFLRKHKHLLPAAQIQEEQMSASLENMLDTNPLPEQMHLQEDLTFQEIADILNQPINTIKSRYRRGLLMLKEQLQRPDG